VRDVETAHEPGPVSLMRWLRRQLRQPPPGREHREAAVANDDPAEAGQILTGAPFSGSQRQYVDEVLERWDRVAK